MRFARRGGGDVDLTPIVPLAADLMLFDDIAQITLSGLEQPVAVLCRLEILDAAVALMFQHKTGVGSGRAVADPHGFDDGDAIVGTELRQPSREVKAAGAAAEHGPIGCDVLLEDVGWFRVR